MITELRAELAADLEPLADLGVKVYPPFPGRVSTPAAIVAYEDGQFIQPGDPPTAGWFTVLLKVTILTGVSVDRLELLESLVETVLSNTGEFAFKGVDEPIMFENIGGQNLFGAAVHLAKQASL